MDWDRAAAARAGGDSPEARVFEGVRRILERRRATPELHGAYPTEILDTHQSGLFAFARRAPTGPLLCIYNFAEFWTTLRADWAHAQGATKMQDALSDAEVTLDAGSILLPPYARLWLR
jgi:amylosucrase